MEDMIYLEDLIKYYFKKIEIVILVTILFFELGVVVKKDTTTTYQESTSIILINPSIDDEKLIGITAGNLDNYLILLNSKRLTNNVISNLQLDETTTSLQRNVTFNMSANSQMITITATNESDELAAKIANTYVTELKNEVKAIYKIDNIMVLDKADTTGNAIISTDNTATILAILGFVISSVIIITIYCFNDNVRIMIRKENIFGAELLKTTFYKRKNKPFESLNSNKDKFIKIKSILCKLMKENKIKTVMITSDGNKLHSNYSANLASSFATVTEKTLLIDCNQNGKLSSNNEDGILDLINSPSNVLTNRIKKYIIKKEELDFLPLGNLEKYNTDLFSSAKFIDVLDKLKSQYDIIFIEVPNIINSFEGMILADIIDTTIITMKKNKITKNRIKKYYDTLDNNKLIAIAPLKRKISLKPKLKKIELPKLTLKKKNKETK